MFMGRNKNKNNSNNNMQCWQRYVCTNTRTNKKQHMFPYFLCLVNRIYVCVDIIKLAFSFSGPKYYVFFWISKGTKKLMFLDDKKSLFGFHLCQILKKKKIKIVGPLAVYLSVSEDNIIHYLQRLGFLFGFKQN